MPLTKRSYSFHSRATKKEINSQPTEAPLEENVVVCTTGRNSSTLKKIKTRGKSFIGRKLNNTEENRENNPEEGPWQRSSVRLRSFRKRKMADRDDVQDVFPPERMKALKMDPSDDIQRRIDDQIRMREGAMRLLSACGNVKQALDASKNLNAINTRVLALMSALQKKRSSLVLKDYNKRNSLEVASLKACPARVAVSNIRIPLMWKDDAHYKERSGDPYLLYYMFCFLKMGDQVLDTLLTQIDHKDTDVTFDGPFVFESVPADFKLDFEIYYTVIVNPDRVHTPSTRASKKGGPLVNIPKYCLAAHRQLDVQDVSDGIITRDLTMGGKGAHATAVLGQKEDLPDNQLNLWGQVCLYLSAQPVCMTSQQKQGTFYLQETNGGQPFWGQYNCKLQECGLECDKISSHGSGSSSNGKVKIKLSKKMRVTESKLSGLGKDHVLILESDGQEKEPVLGFDIHGQCMEWKLALEDSITNIKAWGVACQRLMQFESRQIKLLQSSPKQSLYDQIIVTPVNGNTDDSEGTTVNGETEEMEVEEETSPKEGMTTPIKSNEETVISSVSESKGEENVKEDEESPKMEESDTTGAVNREQVTDDEPCDISQPVIATEENKVEANVEGGDAVEMAKAKTEIDKVDEEAGKSETDIVDGVSVDPVSDDAVARAREDDVAGQQDEPTQIDVSHNEVVEEEKKVEKLQHESKEEEDGASEVSSDIKQDVEQSSAESDKTDDVQVDKESSTTPATSDADNTTDKEQVLEKAEEADDSREGEVMSVDSEDNTDHGKADQKVEAASEVVESEDEPVTDRSRTDTDQAMSAIAALDEVLDSEGDSEGANDNVEKEDNLDKEAEEEMEEGSDHTNEAAVAASVSSTADDEALAKDEDAEVSSVSAEESSSKETQDVQSEVNLPEGTKTAQTEPAANSHLDDDELLDQKIGNLDHDEDELLNQKLNVFNGHPQSTKETSSNNEQSTSKKSFVETEI